MIDLGLQLTGLLALVSLGLVVVLAGVVVVLALRLRRLRHDLAAAIDVGAGEDVLDVLGRHDQELGGLRQDLRTVHGNTEHLRELLRSTVSRVGIVRYDAFDDMGGALSFSAALLDEQGDGIVISAINGRTETRCYAKSIVGQTSEQNLSGEEVAAIDAAVNRRTPAVLPPEGRRRRRRAS
jgi:hypothetical protein